MFCKSNSSKRSYLKNCKKCAMFGDYFAILKQGGCALQINVARDQENIFRFELCVDKI